MAKPNLTCVPEIKHEKSEDSGMRYVVYYTFPHAGVDKPCNYSASCGKNRKLAERLAAAITAGVATSNHKIVATKTADPKTYVQFDNEVFMRYANAELKRLGY